jgi:type II restriction enzyme
MRAGIYFPLFMVLFDSMDRFAVYFLSDHLQQSTMFVPRKPLSEAARRAGWRGFVCDLSKVAPGAFVRIDGVGLDVGRTVRRPSSRVRKDQELSS